MERKLTRQADQQRWAAPSDQERDGMMYEKHDTEQYFFDGPTLDHLANFVSSFDNPCCLSAPLLGKTVVERGYHVRILDVDERFAGVPGFMREFFGNLGAA